jgi:inhibitor of KinA sporulation pathway (predicted exonuclease)
VHPLAAEALDLARVASIHAGESLVSILEEWGSQGLGEVHEGLGAARQEAT